MSMRTVSGTEQILFSHFFQSCCLNTLFVNNQQGKYVSFIPPGGKSQKLNVDLKLEVDKLFTSIDELAVFYFSMFYRN